MSDLAEALAKLHTAQRTGVGAQFTPGESHALAGHLDQIEVAASEAARTLLICARSAGGPEWERTCRQRAQALEAVADPPGVYE